MTNSTDSHTRERRLGGLITLILVLGLFSPGNTESCGAGWVPPEGRLIDYDAVILYQEVSNPWGNTALDAAGATVGQSVSVTVEYDPLIGGGPPPGAESVFYSYAALSVDIGGSIFLSDFSANTTTLVANDQTEFDTYIGDLCPGPPPQTCDYARTTGNNPGVVNILAGLSFDDDIVAGEQRGLNLMVVGGPAILASPEIDLLEGNYDVSEFGDGRLFLDFEGVDPATGALVYMRVVIALTALQYEAVDPPAVPALGGLAGAVLLFGILALGLLTLLLPTPRHAQ